MISLQILDIKNFMSHLLLRDTFDRFFLTEASITTQNTFFIDGHLHKDYYSTDELEIGGLDHQLYSYWSQVKHFCLELIKGKKTPLSFKIIFQLSGNNTTNLLSHLNLSFTPADISGLYLNLHYDGQHLRCITGTSINIFTMDKTLEHSWDSMIKKFLFKNEIPFEENI